MGSCVEAMLGCQSFIGLSALSCGWGAKKPCSHWVEDSSLDFSLISGFKGGWESFHWCGVVVEFIVNWQLRCGTETENGHVHVSNIPMQVVYLADTSGLPFIRH